MSAGVMPLKPPLLSTDSMVARSAGRAMFQRVQYRHGGFAFAQIAGDGLAQHLFGGREVEHVIDDLKGHAQVATVLG